MSECCRSCGSIDLVETVMPAGYVHYSKVECKDCGKFVKWGKKPKDDNKTTGGHGFMNKAILLGRLTKDPEMRYTSTNNTAVCSFTLAVDRKFKQDGQQDADFIPVVAWQKTAEFCGKYFAKGRKVAVSGRIQTRTWDDDNGNKHYVTEIVAEEVDFADSKKDDSGSGQDQKQDPPPQSAPPANDKPQGSSAAGGAPPWKK
jgi:single-strand DNA-binding protein